MAHAVLKRLTREECMAKAKECRDLANQSSAAPTHAAMLEVIAQGWERMANDYRMVERPRE
jgi:hypothetical protein